jgi:TPR repeat protein
MYRKGLGVSQDYAEAARWYRESAEQGTPLAQYNLAYMLDTGLGVPQDYEEAAKWYRASAEQGTARAEYNLGDMYREG